MAITTNTNDSFFEREVYSDLVLEAFKPGLISEAFYRNVADFGSGEVLHIKTIGESTLQEVEEDAPIKFSPIDSGEVQLRITDYKGDGWYITNKARQDMAQVDALLDGKSRSVAHELKAAFEASLLRAAADALPLASSNDLNGQPHVLVGSGTDNGLTLSDILRAQVSMDVADVPANSRVGFIHTVSAANIQGLTTATLDLGANDVWQSVLESGMNKSGHRFVLDIFGFTLITSNNLPTEPAGTTVAGTTITDEAVCNIFMCVADDTCKPLMAAWRQMPTAESDYNMHKQRTEYIDVARWGAGVQRTDSLVNIWTSATALNI